MTSTPKKLRGLAAGATLLCTSAVTAYADNVILDDLIVDGSACIGQDCVNGESFGFDTIRIKENNLRIKAQDTSVSASFPTNDWQLTFNDSTNGGANKFSIDDIDGGRTPFTIEASAPSHSLYVDDGGRIGVGTSTPVVELHVVNGDTPTLRLQQDGSSGFGSLTWDIAGNETNFFVRDASNGSVLPFKIKPSAPSNSLFVDTDGSIGLGADPAADIKLESIGSQTIAALLRGTGNKRFEVQSDNNGAVTMRIRTDSTNRRLMAENAAGDVMGQILFDDNIVRISGGDGVGTVASFSAAGIITDIGTCTTANPCDAVFDPEVYEVPSIKAHAEMMWANKFLPAVGPTANGPVNLNAKMTGILNELEHAHIYIEQLNDRIATLEVLLEQK